MAYHEESAACKGQCKADVVAFAVQMEKTMVENPVADMAKTIYNQHPNATDMKNKFGGTLAQCQAFRTFYEASVAYKQACTAAKNNI